MYSLYISKEKQYNMILWTNTIFLYIVMDTASLILIFEEEKPGKSGVGFYFKLIRDIKEEPARRLATKGNRCLFVLNILNYLFRCRLKHWIWTFIIKHLIANGNQSKHALLFRYEKHACVSKYTRDLFK